MTNVVSRIFYLRRFFQFSAQTHKLDLSQFPTESLNIFYCAFEFCGTKFYYCCTMCPKTKVTLNTFTWKPSIRIWCFYHSIGDITEPTLRKSKFMLLLYKHTQSVVCICHDSNFWLQICIDVNVFINFHLSSFDETLKFPKR